MPYIAAIFTNNRKLETVILARVDFGDISPYPAVEKETIEKYNKSTNLSNPPLRSPDMSLSVTQLKSEAANAMLVKNKATTSFNKFSIIYSCMENLSRAHIVFRPSLNTSHTPQGWQGNTLGSAPLWVEESDGLRLARLPAEPEPWRGSADSTFPS